MPQFSAFFCCAFAAQRTLNRCFASSDAVALLGRFLPISLSPAPFGARLFFWGLLTLGLVQCSCRRARLPPAGPYRRARGQSPAGSSVRSSSRGRGYLYLQRVDMRAGPAIGLRRGPPAKGRSRDLVAHTCAASLPRARHGGVARSAEAIAEHDVRRLRAARARRHRMTIDQHGAAERRRFAEQRRRAAMIRKMNVANAPLGFCKREFTAVNRQPVAGDFRNGAKAACTRGVPVTAWAGGARRTFPVEFGRVAVRSMYERATAAARYRRAVLGRAANSCPHRRLRRGERSSPTAPARQFRRIAPAAVRRRENQRSGAAHGSIRT